MSVDSILTQLQEKSDHLDFQQLLSDIIAEFNCTTGTIHTVDDETKLLILQAQKGIPDHLMDKVSKIPIGKGMAGIAAERRKPVELCNLQTDDSGVARPAARETKVEGSIAAPMLLDEKLFGTLGIAKPDSYEFTEEENKELMQIGEEISRVLRENGAKGV